MLLIACWNNNYNAIIMEQQNNSNKDYGNNKTLIGILIGVLTCLFIFVFLILLDHIMHPTSATSPVGLDTNQLAVEVNAVNNILTWGSFIVAVLTIVAAVFGITGFIQIKSNLDNKLNQFSPIFEEAKGLVKSADELKQSLIAQQTYIEKSNESLMKTVYAIANHIQDEVIAKELLKQQGHIAEIINLYRPCINPEDLVEVRNKKIASLLYLQENGTSDDLPDLVFVLENDPDPDVRAKAQKVIIIIKSGVPSGGTGCCLTRIKNWLRSL